MENSLFTKKGNLNAIAQTKLSPRGVIYLVTHKLIKVDYHNIDKCTEWPPVYMSSVPPHLCVYMLILFTNPSARAGYDTRSIFKQSLTGLNSEFSFSFEFRVFSLTKAEEPGLSYYLPIAGGRIIGFIPISAMWNAISHVQDLNWCRRVHFLRR